MYDLRDEAPGLFAQEDLEARAARDVGDRVEAVAAALNVRRRQHDDVDAAAPLRLQADHPRLVVDGDDFADDDARVVGVLALPDRRGRLVLLSDHNAGRRSRGRLRESGGAEKGGQSRTEPEGPGDHDIVNNVPTMPFVSPLPAIAFGPAGRPVSRLGLGGEGVLRTFGREAEARAVIEAALAEGVTYFESARAYQGSESYLGGSLGARRDRLFLATKAHDRTKAGARAMLEQSLKSLRTGHIDLWQYHDVRTQEDLDGLDEPAGAYAAFVEAKQRGDVRAIGVTGHYSPAVLRAALERVPFDAVLLPVNPAEGLLGDGFEQTVVPAARARGMAVVGMKVFARGALLAGGGIEPADAVRYALSADVDVIVIGCDDAAQVRAGAAAARSFATASAQWRRAFEERARPRAGELAYYRGPDSSDT